MNLARLFCAFVALTALVGCDTTGIPASSDGIYADAQAENRLESIIGGDKSGAPVTAAGTLLGAFLGRDVAEPLKVSDRNIAETTARDSLESAAIGTESKWTNPETGHSGTFTPTNTYHSVDDLLCRDYVQSVSAGGKTGEVSGTACKSDEGTWRVAMEVPPRRAFRPIRDTTAPNRRR